MNQLNNSFNLILGALSFIGIVTGFLVTELQILLWSLSSAILIVLVLGYYVMRNSSELVIMKNKFKKIEESLNIYDRLNKLEIKMNKRGQSINLIELIKWILAILLILALLEAITNSFL